MMAIIIAGGDGTRWGNHLGVPKHLAPILGEPIIHRTQRQLAELGVRDVLVVGTDARYVTTAALVAPRGYQSARGGVKKFLDSSHLWSPGGRTVVMYGDVCFTDTAIRTIVTYSSREWTLFCRFGASHHNPRRWGEVFAQSFYPESHLEHRAALERVARLAERGVLQRAGGWEHYRAMRGLSDEQIAARPAGTNHGAAVVIDDATDDVDRPADYEALVGEFEFQHLEEVC